MIAGLRAAIDGRKKHGGAFRLRIELDLDDEKLRRECACMRGRGR